MAKITPRTIIMTFMLGALIATAPQWTLNHPKANYSAPWIYPSCQPE